MLGKIRINRILIVRSVRITRTPTLEHQRSNTGTRVILKILFDVVDFDGDGEISAFELNGALTALMSGSLAERAKIAFVLFDSKRKGDLSRSDLTRILAAEICVSRRLGYRCTIDKDMSRSPFEIAKLHVEKYFDNIPSPGYFSTFLEWYCSGLKMTKKKKTKSVKKPWFPPPPPPPIQRPPGLSSIDTTELPPPIPSSSKNVPPPIPKDATSSSVSSNDELFRKLVQLRAMFRNDSTNGNKDDDDRESLARELEKEKMRVANLEAEIVGLRKLRTREESPTKKSFISSSAPVSPLLPSDKNTSPFWKSSGTRTSNTENFNLDSIPKPKFVVLPSNLKKSDTELLEKRLSMLNSSLEAAMNQMDTLERTLG